MARHMLRHRVTVNGHPHTFKLGHSPVHVEASRLGVSHQAPHAVDFWAEDESDDHGELDTRITRTFQVFGTGHPLPEDARWRGTARADDGLVWHLYELPTETP